MKGDQILLRESGTLEELRIEFQKPLRNARYCIESQLQRLAAPLFRSRSFYRLRRQDFRYRAAEFLLSDCGCRHWPLATILAALRATSSAFSGWANLPHLQRGGNSALKWDQTGWPAAGEDLQPIAIKARLYHCPN